MSAPTAATAAVDVKSTPASPAAAGIALPSAVRVFPTSTELSNSVGEYIAELSTAAIDARGVFRVAFSGGSLPKLVAAGLLVPAIRTQIAFDKWEVYFCDERLVPASSADSNYKLLKAELITPLFGDLKAEVAADLESKHVFPIDFTKIADPAAAAAAYQKLITEKFGASVAAGAVPTFDLVLLGMGEDGHTCSLFPAHKLLAVAADSKSWIESITDSPKPPPARITFTLPLVNSARNAAFVATGAGKRPVLTKLFTPATAKAAASEFPCGMIALKSGCAVDWFIDTTAAPAGARVTEDSTPHNCVTDSKQRRGSVAPEDDATEVPPAARHDIAPSDPLSSLVDPTSADEPASAVEAAAAAALRHALYQSGAIGDAIIAGHTHIAENTPPTSGRGPHPTPAAVAAAAVAAAKK